MRARLRTATVAGVLTAGVVLTASVSLALHRYTPPFVQVTIQGSGDVGRSAAWGAELMTFEASGDVLANGNIGWQLYLFDLASRDFHQEPGLTQITFGPFNARVPSISRSFAMGGMVVPPTVAFEADGGLCTNPANHCDANALPTTGRQIFVFHTDTGTIQQVTRGPGSCHNPDISGNGRWVVFDSTTDLTGTGLIGSTPELYQGDLQRLGPACPQLPCSVPPGDDNGLMRLTMGGGQHGSVSFNGTGVAFESRGDLVLPNANPGVQQIYAIRKGVLAQVTSGPYDARAPSLNGNGKAVAYEQDTLFPNVPEPVSQIFVTRLKRYSLVVAQMTDAASGSFAPSIAPNGWRVSFTSSADLLDNQSTGNQIFTRSLRRSSQLIQITNGTEGADSVTSTSQVIVGFASADDIKGTGNTTRQFWVANFFKDAPPDFVSPPGTPTPGQSVGPTPVATASNAPTATAVLPLPTPTFGAATTTPPPLVTPTPTPLVPLATPTFPF